MQPTPETLAEIYAAKSDEELRSLHRRGTLTGVAYEVLEGELQSRGIAVSERPDSAQLEEAARRAHERTTLAGHWHGRASLASAYWLVGTLGFWLVYGAVLLTKMFLPVLMPLAWAAMVAFLVFAWVSIWRCSRNARWPVWGYVARSIVVLDAIFVLAVAARLISEALQPQSVFS
jgi:hypothetical protein